VSAYLLILVGFFGTPQARPVTSIAPDPSADACQEALVDAMHKIGAAPDLGSLTPVAKCIRIEKPEAL
jgi:hypothetical protein